MSKVIKRPALPPRAGYVEAEANGTRVYVNVRTGAPLGREGELPSLTALLASVTGLEDALCEMDAMAGEWMDGLDRAVGEIETALCELDERISEGG